jgi:hypothetical protein
MPRHRPHWAALAILLCVAGPGRAARPMVTDDARIVDSKACQVETWGRRNPDTAEYWALPACKPSGNLEITAGGALASGGDDAGLADKVLQAKTLFRPLEDNWGWGIAVGTILHPHGEASRTWPGDPYLYFPASFKARGDGWIVHFNAGATRDRDAKRTFTTWGFGNEIRLNNRLFFIAEAFATDGPRPWQGGLRFWIVKDRVQVDATYGNRMATESAERWFTVGLRLLSPPFLP